ncbi:MAG: TonB-dependent siderophore receptor [Bacteroidota bacterium]
MKKYISALILSLSFTAITSAQQSDLALRDNDTIKTEANDTVKKKKIRSLDEITITSNQQRKPISAVRSGLKPMDNPQSLQVLGSEIIEQQQSIRLSDVIKNANGVYVASSRGGAQESFFSRGYDMGANNMFKNGFRQNSGSMPEVSSLEKVEILKGSSALLFGNVTPGGILNMVTKTPSFKSGGEFSMQGGSYDFYKPSLDIYGPLNSVIAYRVTASYENAESFRDVVARERYYVNPSVLFKTSEKTDIILQGDYLHDNWTPDFGNGAIIGKKLVDLPRNNYLGAKWSNGQTRQASVSGLIKHSFNENWKLNGNISLQDYTRKSEGTERIQPSDNPATYGNFVRPLGKNNQSELIVAEQISLQGNFNTGKIKHQIFTGVDGEYSFAKTYTYAFSTANYDPSSSILNVFDPSSYQNEYAIPSARNTKIANTDTSRFGVYFQDLVSITEKIKVLAGVRWSWQTSRLTNYNETFSGGVQTVAPENAVAKKDPIRNDAAFSPKFGLVYQPTKTMTLFSSYATSFTPNTGLDINNKVIEPSIINQYEAGVKTEFFNGLLSTNVTLYQIENNNLAQIAPALADGTLNNNSNIKMLSGETKSKGVEVDVTIKPIEGFSINTGYSYNDMRYTKTNGLVGSFVVGDRIWRTPAHTANLSFFYTVQGGFFKGFSVGSIANYIGDRLGGWNRDYQKDSSGNMYIRDRQVPLEGYITVDASAGYTWKQFSLLCKLSNITNELNYTVHENYSVNPIAPRQIMTSLKYKF